MNRLNLIILLISVLFLCSCQTIDVEHTPDYDVIETSSNNDVTSSIDSTTQLQNQLQESQYTLAQLKQDQQQLKSELQQLRQQGNEDKSRINMLEEQKRNIEFQLNELNDKVRREEEQKQRQHFARLEEEKKQKEEAQRKKIEEEKKRKEEAQRRKLEEEKRKKNSWHIRAITYAKTEQPTKEAENVVKLFSQNNISDVVLRKASSGNWVIDVGFFPAKNDPEALKVQETIWNLKYEKLKMFHDAYFVQY